MVAPDFNPSTHETEAGGSLSESQASVVYRASFMIIRAMQRNPVLENQSGQGKVKRFVAIAENQWYYTGLTHSVFESAKLFSLGSNMALPLEGLQGCLRTLGNK